MERRYRLSESLLTQFSPFNNKFARFQPLQLHCSKNDIEAIYFCEAILLKVIEVGNLSEVKILHFPTLWDKLVKP